MVKLKKQIENIKHNLSHSYKKIVVKIFPLSFLLMSNIFFTKVKGFKPYYIFCVSTFFKKCLYGTPILSLTDCIKSASFVVFAV